MATGTMSRYEVVHTNQTLLSGDRHGSWMWETDGWVAGCEAAGGHHHYPQNLQRGNSGQGARKSLRDCDNGRFHPDWPWTGRGGDGTCRSFLLFISVILSSKMYFPSRFAKVVSNQCLTCTIHKKTQENTIK